MTELKYSRQREAILENLRMRKDHPTADSIYDSLRTEYPHLSLGTVYRNLNLLQSIGKIRKISCGDGIEHYDYDTALDHYHFYCKGCGKVIDIDTAPMERIDNMVDSQDVGIVDSHSLVFYGYCKECLGKTTK